MKAISKIFCAVWLSCLCLILPAAAQQSLPATAAPNAAATAVSPSTGMPSTIQIQQNILTQKIRAVNSQIQVAQRCIANASRPEVLRDPQGNVNIVPSQDITNCTRTLTALQRQLASLGRQVAKLAQDAQVQAAFLQAKQKQLQAQKSSSSQRRRFAIKGNAF